MDSSTLWLVLVSSDCILRCRNRIVRQPLVIEAVAARVALLFVGGAVAFDRALVDVRVLVRREAGGRHSGSPHNRVKLRLL